MDGVDNGMLPGLGKLTGCETGVEDEEEDMTDGIETNFEDPDANTVRVRGRGIFHREKSSPKRMKCYRAE